MSDKPISPLRRRMIDDMTARRFKEKVQKDYVRHVRTFAGIVTLAKNSGILEGSSTTLELSKPLIFLSAADDRFARLTSKSRQRDNAPEREHALVAIREAFDAAVRQIENVMREFRGQVKHHAEASHGRVKNLLAREDYGFIETADGRQIYFHRNAVLDAAFDRLKVGSEVTFAEEEGVKGPQASTVRVVGGHRRA